MNLFEFFSNFGSTEKCANYFIQNDLVYENLECECGQKMKKIYRKEKLCFRCSKHSCRKDIFFDKKDEDIHNI